LISGKSMQPTLNPARPSFLKRDLVLCLPASFKKSCRGDVVILRSPLDPSLRLVKRIVALENDHVRLSPEDAKQILEMEEDKESKNEALGLYRKIPEGSLWVEGDAPSYCSQDSRFFGPIPKPLIEGYAQYILWPPSRMGRV
ncbi:peptidase S24/S26A/S26B/S26C, partial [Piptocephalis cylindrospora]